MKASEAIDFCVYKYKNKKYMVNPRLVEKQGLTEKDIKGIVYLHKYRKRIFSKMEKETDVNKLKSCADKLKEVEFKLQGLWKFPLNDNFHRWFDVPQCSCPKMDNEDSLGTPYRIYNQDCIIHGS